MATRAQNEHDFPNWDDLPDGGRCYWVDRQGRVQGFARYIKMVDANEVTLSILQEIYNAQGQLIEIHKKYPVDEGHQRIAPGNED